MPYCPFMIIFTVFKNLENPPFYSHAKRANQKDLPIIIIKKNTFFLVICMYFMNRIRRKEE